MAGRETGQNAISAQSVREITLVEDGGDGGGTVPGGCRSPLSTGPESAGLMHFPAELRPPLTDLEQRFFEAFSNARKRQWSNYLIIGDWTNCLFPLFSVPPTTPPYLFQS